MRKHLLFGAALLGVGSLAALSRPTTAADPVKDAEQERIATIKRVRPAVVNVFVKDFSTGDPRGRVVGGGSGVIIDKEGYALTNYHVVEGRGGITPTFACGLPNGVMYDAVTVGVDKMGDVALIKLFPKKPGEVFPVAELGDSSELKAGDWTMNMGNAQLLSTDFTPSISFGLVSGVGRYSDFGFAEHTDAIQYDTTANQGNSGGPIFNQKGQVVGLVYGGAPGKRGAFNTGIGYGLPINTAKNFLGHMKAGIFCDHATLGATVSPEASDDGELSRLLVNAVLDDSDAGRRGIAEGDELISFAGRSLRSVNHFKSALGVFPKEWRLPLVYKQKGEQKETLVRLMSFTPGVIGAPPKKDGPPPPAPRAFGEGAKFWEMKKGFVNYYFNKKERERVLASMKKLADYSALTNDWVVTGTYDRENRGGDFLIKIADVPDPNDAKNLKPIVNLSLGLTEYKLDPLNFMLKTEELTDPPYTGGLMMAMYQYRHFLTLKEKDLENNNCAHAGYEPTYLFPADGSKVKNFADIRVMAEVIRTDHANVKAKWYVYRADLNPRFGMKHPFADGTLFAAEVLVDSSSDPCEIYFGDFKDVSGKQLPHKMEVRHGDKRFGMFTIKAQQLK